MKRSIFVLVLIFLLATAASAFASAESEYETALKLYHSGKYKQAAEYLKGYVNSTPDPSAYYLIGYSLYKLGKFSEATQYFEQAYLIDPNFSPEESGLSEKFPENLPVPKNKKRTSGKKKSAQGAVKKKPGEQMIMATKQNEKQTPPKQNQANKLEKATAPVAVKTAPRQPVKQSAPSPAEKKPQVQKQNQVNAATKQSDKQPAALKQTAQNNQPDKAMAAATTGVKNTPLQNAGQKPSPVSAPAATQAQKATPQTPGVQDKVTGVVNKAQTGAKTTAQQAKKAVAGIMPVVKDPLVLGGLAAAIAAVFLGTGLILFLRKKRKGSRAFDQNDFE